MTDDDKAIENPQHEAGGFNITIGKDVGPGAVVGSGSVKASNIAGGDIVTSSEVVGKTREDFHSMLGELQKLIEQAQQADELDEKAAKTALDNVQAAADLVKKKLPPKRRLLRKLEDVADILDGAAETIDAAGGVARVVLKAMPVAALLLKLASYLY